MRQQKTIGLIGPMSVPHVERMFRGIIDFGRSRARWRFFFDPELSTLSLSSLEHCPVDAAFAFVSDPKDVEVARRIRIPIVNLSSQIEGTRLPTVVADSEAMGRLAAEHLIERGFKHLAYFGRRHARYSKLRGIGFKKAIQKAGLACQTFEDAPLARRRGDDLRKWVEQVDARLRRFPLPLGLFVVHDHRARMVMEICYSAGLRVPEDVAIVGANNDTIVCELCQPSLTSVPNNGWEVGRKAAEEMHRRLTDPRYPAKTVVVQPGAVVARDSTNTVVIDDPEVRAAALHIRRHVEEHPAEPLSIDNLVAEAAVSRRWLEQRFPKYLGCSIKEYIDETRVRTARQLLLQTAPRKLRLYEIAQRCGFQDTRRFRLVFERFVGMTPAAYRNATAAEPDSNESR